MRGLRELVRHRAKLVALRSGLKAQVHAVLAKQGLLVPVSDLFGVAGRTGWGAHHGLSLSRPSSEFCSVIVIGIDPHKSSLTAVAGLEHPVPRCSPGRGIELYQ